MKKRLFAALLAGSVALSLMACGGSGSSSSSAPAADPAAQGETGEAAASGDGSYAVDVIVKTTASEYWAMLLPARMHTARIIRKSPYLSRVQPVRHLMMSSRT